jgi:hypothetical protein
MDFAGRGIRHVTNDRNVHDWAITWTFRKGDSVFALGNAAGGKPGSEKNLAVGTNLAGNDERL